MPKRKMNAHDNIPSDDNISSEKDNETASEIYYNDEDINDRIHKRMEVNEALKKLIDNINNFLGENGNESHHTSKS